MYDYMKSKSYVSGVPKIWPPFVELYLKSYELMIHYNPVLLYSSTTCLQKTSRSYSRSVWQITRSYHNGRNPTWRRKSVCTRRNFSISFNFDFLSLIYGTFFKILIAYLNIWYDYRSKESTFTFHSTHNHIAHIILFN